MIDLTQSGASPGEIAADPAVVRAREKQRSYPPTTENPGYGTPDYEKTRDFNIKGQRVKGYDAAHEHLLDVARAKDKRKVEKQRIAVIVTGPPASGKSTVANEIALRIGAAIRDPDDAKELMPEYRGGIGANAVHQESLRLSRRLFRELSDNGENLVIPVVGQNANGIRELAADLRAKLYTVSLVNLQLTPMKPTAA